jgi:hypothetical protein
MEDKLGVFFASIGRFYGKPANGCEALHET